MKIFLLFLLPLIAVAGEISEREKKLFREIRCIVCNSQSIYDSNSSSANDMKNLISMQINDGKSDIEIKKYLIERFGDQVLFSPPFNIATFFLWIAPFTILIIGILFFFSQGIAKKHL